MRNNIFRYMIKLVEMVLVKWSIIIVLCVENSVDWFEIELRSYNFEEYNEKYILQVVDLYNDMSNYEFKGKKILNFIDAYSSDKEVHERRDNWSMSDFYMLEQNIRKKEVVFTVGGWLKKEPIYRLHMRFVTEGVFSESNMFCI